MAVTRYPVRYPVALMDGVQTPSNGGAHRWELPSATATDDLSAFTIVIVGRPDSLAALNLARLSFKAGAGNGKQVILRGGAPASPVNSLDLIVARDTAFARYQSPANSIEDGKPFIAFLTYDETDAIDIYITNPMASPRTLVRGTPAQDTAGSGTTTADTASSTWHFWNNNSDNNAAAGLWSFAALLNVRLTLPECREFMAAPYMWRHRPETLAFLTADQMGAASGAQDLGPNKYDVTVSGWTSLGARRQTPWGIQTSWRDQYLSVGNDGSPWNYYAQL